MSVTTWADLVADRPTTGDWVAAGTWQVLLKPAAEGTGVIFATASVGSSSGWKGGRSLALLAASVGSSSGWKGGKGRATLSVEPFVGIHTGGVGSTGIIQASVFSFAGTKTSQGDGLLYVTDAPTIDGHKQQWYFTPPTRRVYGHGDRFWRRVHIDQGVTVIRRGEAFIVTETPSAEDFEEADRVYVGGYVYQIDDDERLALQAAGYDPFPEDVPAQIPDALWADLVANAPTTGDWVAAGTWLTLLQTPSI